MLDGTGVPFCLSEVPAPEAVQHYCSVGQIGRDVFQASSFPPGVSSMYITSKPVHWWFTHDLLLHKPGLKGLIPLVIESVLNS